MDWFFKWVKEFHDNDNYIQRYIIIKAIIIALLLLVVTVFLALMSGNVSTRIDGLYEIIKIFVRSYPFGVIVVILWVVQYIYTFCVFKIFNDNNFKFSLPTIYLRIASFLISIIIVNWISVVKLLVLNTTKYNEQIDLFDLIFFLQLFYYIPFVILPILYMLNLKVHRKKEQQKLELNNFSLDNGDFTSNYNIYYRSKDIEENNFKDGDYNTVIFSNSEQITNFYLCKGEYDSNKKTVLLLRRDDFFGNGTQHIRVKTGKIHYFVNIKNQREILVIEHSILKKANLAYIKKRMLAIKKKMTAYIKKAMLAIKKIMPAYIKKAMLAIKKAMWDNVSKKEINIDSLIEKLLQNHYYISEKGKEVINQIETEAISSVGSKTILVDGIQGSGKTSFLKKAVTNIPYTKPVFISIWQEGESKDPLSVISNALLHDMKPINRFLVEAIRWNFNIFHAIALMAFIVMHIKGTIEYKFTSEMPSFVVDLNGKSLCPIVCIFLCISIYFILNYIELEMLLFKTGNSTNDSHKFQKFIKKSLKKRIIIIEDFERIQDFQKVNRWIEVIDALNAVIDTPKVRIILTYDKQVLNNSRPQVIYEEKACKTLKSRTHTTFESSKMTKRTESIEEISLMDESTRKRILVEGKVYEYEPDIENYKKLLANITKCERFNSCKDFRDIHNLKRQYTAARNKKSQ